VKSNFDMKYIKRKKEIRSRVFLRNISTIKILATKKYFVKSIQFMFTFWFVYEKWGK